ncbi:MAG TPA: VIT1/CCC1 transporter family protein [Ignavibacteria bacterium]|nr:VIT1/CCC1 transporter family protein [Ignavibacteria bacterium]
MSNLHPNELHNASKTRLDRIQGYLSEFVYGGIDGSVTTFAVVAGSTGANLDPSVIIILGFANLFADGFSMSVGNYLSTKSSLEQYEKQKKHELWEIENLPEVEKDEIREIYRAKGFEGELLDKIVDVITSDKERWLDVMMKEELEMVPEKKPPVKTAAVTFFSFIAIGFIPLITYVWEYLSGQSVGDPFLITSILTGVAFLIIGYLKAVVNKTSRLKGILWTLFLGGAAAVVAYYVGNVLEKLFR